MWKQDKGGGEEIIYKYRGNNVLSLQPEQIKGINLPYEIK